MDPKTILGELQEFKRQSISWQEKIEKKVDDLLRFRWFLLGVSTVVSFLVSTIIEAIISRGK